MKLIPLTQGQFAKVDDADFDSLAVFKWFAYWNVTANTFYARRAIPMDLGKQTVVAMHRQILGLEKGNKRDGEHRDHDGLNNQRSNLRVATRSQNMMNRGPCRNNALGFKGICKRPSGRYAAYTRLNGKAIHFGTFSTIKEAVAFRLEKIKELHGEFAQ